MTTYKKVQGVNLHLDIELVVTRAGDPQELDSSAAETDYISAGGPLSLAGSIAPQDLLTTLNQFHASLADMAEAAYEMVMTLACAGLKDEARACREMYQQALAGWMETIYSTANQKEEASTARHFLAEMLDYDIDAQAEPQEDEA